LGKSNVVATSQLHLGYEKIYYFIPTTLLLEKVSFIAATSNVTEKLCFLFILTTLNLLEKKHFMTCLLSLRKELLVVNNIDVVKKRYICTNDLRVVMKYNFYLYLLIINKLFDQFASLRQQAYKSLVKKSYLAWFGFFYIYTQFEYLRYN